MLPVLDGGNIVLSGILLTDVGVWYALDQLGK